MHYRRVLLLAFGLLFATACTQRDNAHLDQQVVDPGADDLGRRDLGAPHDASTAPDAGNSDTNLASDTGGAPSEAPPREDRPEIERIACDNPAPPQGVETCVVSPGDGDLVALQGTVLAPNGVIYENGLVVFERNGDQSDISCVGCDCDDTAGFAQATRVQCADGVISPGLINPHDHIGFAVNEPRDHGEERYEHRHDWRRGRRGHSEIRVGRNPNGDGTVWGEVRMLAGGATSMVGAGGSDGLVRNLDRNQEGLGAEDVFNQTFPLDDSGGTLRDTGCDYGQEPDTAIDIVDACSYLTHISEGIDLAARNEFICTSQATQGEDVVAPNTALVHAVGLTAIDAAELQLNDSQVVWSPRSNIDLYGNTAQVTMFHRMGIVIALGTDWSASGSANMLRELACADQFNQDHLDGYFDDVELFNMATEWAAIVTAADHRIGRLEAGLVADIAVFDGSERSEHRAVIAADGADVVLVLRGGMPLYGDAALVDALSDANCEGVTLCDRQKRICMQETGKSISQLRTSIGGDRFPAFFCDQPDLEPSCVPFRPGEYTGVATGDDRDGDGIIDSQDNCTLVFNPVRPLDEGAQPDFDRDGLGDVCDPCPLTPNGSQCADRSTQDRDGDGAPNDVDNCPEDYNPEQADGDNDQLGDACDLCPEHDSRSGGSCPFDIRDLRDPASPSRPPLGSQVAVSNLVVVGVRGDLENNLGFYAQDADLSGADFTGIWVFTNNDVPRSDDGTALSPGDVVTVEGEFVEFNGIDELAALTSVVVDGHQAPPQPRVVSPDQLAPRSASGNALESLLVRVEGVRVARFLEPDFVESDAEDEFFVTDAPQEQCVGETPGCAMVGDFLYDGGDDANNAPSAAVNDQFVSITGFVNGYSERFSIDVRDDADLVR